MKHLLLTCTVLSICLSSILAQEYFIKTYDRNDIRSSLQMSNFIIENDLIIAKTAHACAYMVDSICNTLYYIDKFTGEKVDSITLAFAGGNRNPFIKEESRYVFSGRNPYNYRKTFENAILDSNGFHIISVEHDSLNSIINQGIVQHKGYYYTYGTARIINNNELMGYIVKWNPSLDSIIWTKIINVNAKENQVFDLQVTPDGHLAYLIYATHIKDIATAPPFDPQAHYFIRKMDENGKTLNEYFLGDWQLTFGYFPNMLALSDGTYIMHSYESFWDWENASPRTGKVIKINQEMNDQVWSTYMPWEDTGHPRALYREQATHEIWDIYECRNGDVLVAGHYEDPLANILEEEKHAEGAFLTRFDSQTGEMLWHRNYLMPTDSTDGYRQDYRPFYFKKIKEDDNGDIYGMGTFRRGLPPQYDRRVFNTFLFRVNEHGCLEPNDCDTALILNTNDLIIADYTPHFFDPPYPNPVNDYLQLGHIPYERYTLYDLTGKKVQSGRYQSQINMSSMQRGMYFLELMDRQMHSYTFKIVKQ